MKQITFTSFKGGAGKTTAAMTLTSALSQAGNRIALIDTDENIPLIDWRESAIKNEAWSDDITVFEADDLRSLEDAYEEAEKNKYDYVIIDTRGGGSELNNACLINTDMVIIPSALTTLDMTQALSTFEHVINVHQSVEIELPIALLVQRAPIGKLTKAQQKDLDALLTLPCCETHLHSRDAYSALGKRGLLYKTHEALMADPHKRIIANHLSTAMVEAQSFANDIIETIGD